MSLYSPIGARDMKHQAKAKTMRKPALSNTLSKIKVQSISAKEIFSRTQILSPAFTENDVIHLHESLYTVLVGAPAATQVQGSALHTKPTAYDAAKLVFTHEVAHIVYHHRARSRKMVKDHTVTEPDGTKKCALSAKHWVASQELEVARRVYPLGSHGDALIRHLRDTAAKGSVWEMVGGGYLADSLPVPEHLTMCEDIYDWLMSQKKDEEEDKGDDDKDDGDKDEMPKVVCATCKANAPEQEGGDGDSGEEGDEEGSTGGSVGDPEEDDGDGDTVGVGAIEKLVDEIIGDAVKATVATLQQKSPPNSIKNIRYYTALSNIVSSLTKYQKLVETSRKVSPSYHITGVITPTWVLDDVKPALHVYVDRSGSFDESKTAESVGIIQRLGATLSQEIQTQLYYFGNDEILEVDPKYGRGGTPYELIHEHIQETDPMAVVIITDDDWSTMEVRYPDTDVWYIGVQDCKTKVGKMFGGKNLLA